MSEILFDPFPDSMFRGVEWREDTQRLSGERLCSCGEWAPFDIGHLDRLSSIGDPDHGKCRRDETFHRIVDWFRVRV